MLMMYPFSQAVLEKLKMSFGLFVGVPGAVPL
jgi:hypothetical protein